MKMMMNDDSNDYDSNNDDNDAYNGIKSYLVFSKRPDLQEYVIKLHAGSSFSNYEKYGTCAADNSEKTTKAEL